MMEWVLIGLLILFLGLRGAALLQFRQRPPAQFVPGPWVHAVDLAKKQTHQYPTYIAGFALLAV